MRGLRRDQKNIYYSLYSGKVPVLDENGDETGDYDIGYENPVCFKASVSPARSEASVEQFGVNADYDKTLISFDKNLPIKETTMLFVDVVPNEDFDNYDYKVCKIAKSHSSVTIAIKKLTKSEE